MYQIVLATNNSGKVAELAEPLATIGFEVIPQSQLGVQPIAETGLTFVENALLKARHAATITGTAALADDAGLTVDALHGAPGLYSSRYAGEHATDCENRNKLLQALQHIPFHQRRAQLHCTLVYLRHTADTTPIICYATWHGIIATHVVGEEGFGYDPLFYLPELRCTAAQLTPQQKQHYSHRGEALRQLIEQLSHA